MFLKVFHITLKKFLVLFFFNVFWFIHFGIQLMFFKMTSPCKIEGRRRRGWQKMRWLDGIADGHEWASSGSWWWTGKPVVLQSMGLQRVGHDCVTGLNWTESLQMGRTKTLHDPALSYLFCLISYLAPTHNPRHTEPPFPPTALQNASTSVLFLVESSTLFPKYLHEVHFASSFLDSY